MLKHLLKVKIWQQNVTRQSESLSGNWWQQTDISLGEDAGGTPRMKAITTRYCLKFLNFGKLSIPPTETFTQQRFPTKTPTKWCLFEVHPPGFSQLLPGVCWDLVAKTQVKILPVSRQKNFSKTVTRRNTECSSSAAHLAKERRSTAAPSAPFVRASKHLQNRRTQSACRCWNIFSKWNSDSKMYPDNLNHSMEIGDNQLISFGKITWDAEDQDNHNSLLSEAFQLWRFLSKNSSFTQQRFPAKTPAKWCLFEVHPPGFSQLLPGVCRDLVAVIQTELLPGSRQKEFSKTVTRHNSECSSSAAHLAKERRSTAAPLAPTVSESKHLENIRGMKSDNRMSLAFLYQRTPKTSFEEITWDAEDQGNHNSVLSEVSQLCQSVTSKNWNPSCNNIFLPRHRRNDAFSRFTHLASPSCFHASAGILSHQSKLRSFRFQDKRSSQRPSHVTTQNVPPALRIWPRKGGARRPHLRPLCPDWSTFKTGRTQSAFRCWNIFSKWQSDSKVSCCITQWKFETTQQNNRTSFTWDM